MATVHCLDHTFTNIEAIVFDKDGTLADVESFLKSLGQKCSSVLEAEVPGVQDPLLRAFGIEETYINPAGLLAVGSRYENKIAAAAYVAATGRNWLEALEMVESAFNEADTYLIPKAEHTPLLANSLETLNTLSKTGLKLGILSADSSDNVQEFLDTYHLQALFQAAQGVDGTISKPDPSLFIDICAQMETPPNRTLMIGDAPVDMKMAKSADAAGCIFVTWGWHAPIPTHLADISLDSWQQLTISP
ncbi:HAD family hydrolase [Acaryochloris sp. 'Moss Beach']|uniref:HAD family hydrolase n=1 Tax=Acaryochloris sp. 'Moss Beach' TaxID=2740837 RepID=UPI001F26B64F|nr:HAD family hydrolase [Acaryochloris sp. 'Moss Beach']UJB69387.1 HAD family hydrolase [Acaryochloris sp. 'Moss Beach']